ncbi:MAG: CinA family protein [Leucobacter sp.]
MSDATRVIELAKELGVRITVAESLTGGLLASALVDVPGASHVFAGGIVAYDTELKASLLGVDRELLRTRGPVDIRVAEQMAVGVRKACAREDLGPVDIGIATTGVAGPDPDAQSGQIVGTVWIGVSSPLGERSVRCEELAGDRQKIRQASVQAALAQLYSELRSIQDHRS